MAKQTGQAPVPVTVLEDDFGGGGRTTPPAPKSMEKIVELLKFSGKQRPQRPFAWPFGFKYGNPWRDVLGFCRNFEFSLFPRKDGEGKWSHFNLKITLFVGKGPKAQPEPFTLMIDGGTGKLMKEDVIFTYETKNDQVKMLLDLLFQMLMRQMHQLRRLVIYDPDYQAKRKSGGNGDKTEH